MLSERSKNTIAGVAGVCGLAAMAESIAHLSTLKSPFAREEVPEATLQIAPPSDNEIKLVRQAVETAFSTTNTQVDDAQIGADARP